MFLMKVDYLVAYALFRLFNCNICFICFIWFFQFLLHKWFTKNFDFRKRIWRWT